MLQKMMAMPQLGVQKKQANTILSDLLCQSKKDVLKYLEKHPLTLETLQAVFTQKGIATESISIFLNSGFALNDAFFALYHFDNHRQDVGIFGANKVNVNGKEYPLQRLAVKGDHLRDAEPRRLFLVQLTPEQYVFIDYIRPKGNEHNEHSYIEMVDAKLAENEELLASIRVFAPEPKVDPRVKMVQETIERKLKERPLDQRLKQCRALKNVSHDMFFGIMAEYQQGLGASKLTPAMKQDYWAMLRNVITSDFLEGCTLEQENALLPDLHEQIKAKNEQALPIAALFLGRESLTIEGKLALVTNCLAFPPEETRSFVSALLENQELLDAMTPTQKSVLVDAVKGLMRDNLWAENPVKTYFLATERLDLGLSPTETFNTLKKLLKTKTYDANYTNKLRVVFSDLSKSLPESELENWVKFIFDKPYCPPLIIQDMDDKTLQTFLLLGIEDVLPLSADLTERIIQQRIRQYTKSPEIDCQHLLELCAKFEHSLKFCQIAGMPPLVTLDTKPLINSIFEKLKTVLIRRFITEADFQEYLPTINTHLRHMGLGKMLFLLTEEWQNNALKTHILYNKDFLEHKIHNLEKLKQILKAQGIGGHSIDHSVGLAVYEGIIATYAEYKQALSPEIKPLLQQVLNLLYEIHPIIHGAGKPVDLDSLTNDMTDKEKNRANQEFKNFEKAKKTLQAPTKKANKKAPEFLQYMTRVDLHIKCLTPIKELFTIYRKDSKHPTYHARYTEVLNYMQTNIPKLMQNQHFKTLPLPGKMLLYNYLGLVASEANRPDLMELSSRVFKENIDLQEEALKIPQIRQLAGGSSDVADMFSTAQLEGSGVRPSRRR